MFGAPLAATISGMPSAVVSPPPPARLFSWMVVMPPMALRETTSRRTGATSVPSTLFVASTPLLPVELPRMVSWQLWAPVPGVNRALVEQTTSEHAGAGQRGAWLHGRAAAERAGQDEAPLWERRDIKGAVATQFQSLPCISRVRKFMNALSTVQVPCSISFPALPPL